MSEAGGAIEEQSIKYHDSGHGFDHGHGAGHYTWIVSATPFDDYGAALAVDRGDLLQ